MDVIEKEPEKENDSDSDDEDLEDEEDCKITGDEEQEPVQANISALDTLIASSQNHDAFDCASFAYQRGPEPSKKHSSEDPSGSDSLEQLPLSLAS